MYYELLYDMENIDKSIRKGTNAIYAEATNMDEIEYPGIRKGFFDRIILKALLVDIKWPEVIFYYSSKVSTRESDYLLNIKRFLCIKNFHLLTVFLLRIDNCLKF